MKSIVAAVAAAAVLVGVAAQDKKDPKKEDKKVDAAKLLGRWELTRSTLDPRPKSAIVEFTKDNKVTVAVTAGNGKEDKYTGTYKVDGDKLTVKLTIPGETDQEDTDTIQTLTDEKLLLIDKDKKETEFAKKK